MEQMKGGGGLGGVGVGLGVGGAAWKYFCLECRRFVPGGAEMITSSLLKGQCDEIFYFLFYYSYP